MFDKNKTLFMCPGQGSQHVGMAQEFMDIPETKHFFAEADDTLSMHLTSLMRNGDASVLAKTENTQPALLLASYVAFKFLEKQTGKTIKDLAKYVAGHSLGEYSALAINQTLSFSDALRLVQKRGQAMQKAVPIGVGSMAAIISNLTIDELEKHLIGECWVANDNAIGQIVISGKVDAVNLACEKIKNAGAKRVVMLDVSAPFHSPLMKMASDVMAEEFEKITFNKPQVPLIQNTTAEIIDDEKLIKQGLIEQVCGKVKWRESMQNSAKHGSVNLYELGSGKVLTGLAKRCDLSLKAKALNTPKQIDELLEELI